MSLPDDQIDELLHYFFFDFAGKHREDRRQNEQLTTDCLLDWSKRFLPRHFSIEPSKMHYWLADHLDQARSDRGTKINLLAPRGAAKSTVATLAYPLRELLENREPYVWIVSDTMSQAHAHLENIKNELLENKSLARRYRTGNFS